MNPHTQEAIKSYEDDIEKNGFSIQTIDLLIKAITKLRLLEYDIAYASEVSAKTKKYINDYVKRETKGGNIWDLEKYAQEQNNGTRYVVLDKFYELLLLESYDNFQSFMYYMERNRPWKKRFYQPRRKTLKVVADDLMRLENDPNMKFYGLSMPSRVGKSTICIFFLAWIALRKPNSHSAMGGHSGILAKGFYKELINLIDTEEYTYEEMYKFWHPKSKKMIRDRSADEFTITLDSQDRFATITCRGVDGTWTGAVDVSQDGYLYVDDLVRDREHSLSPQRMETTFQEYNNKMVDRKNDGAKELMVGTLWNVLDPLERLRQKYENTPGYFFRRIPALDDNDESNFNYEVNGFSTQYYHEMRERIEKPEWEAKFMQRPFVREGLLFPSDELRYFNGVLPEGDYRRVAALDVAWGGGDSLSMPIGAEYENGDVYIYDWVFNKGPKEVTLPLVTGKIVSNEIRQLRVEGNTGGDLYTQYIGEKLSFFNYKCSCTSQKAPNTTDKLSKIIAYSGDIKRKYIFIAPNIIETTESLEEDARLGVTRHYRSKEYQAAMNEMTMFVQIGKNEHDDAVDSLTQLEMFLENPSNSASVKATFNPYRRY